MLSGEQSSPAYTVQVEPNVPFVKYSLVAQIFNFTLLFLHFLSMSEVPTIEPSMSEVARHMGISLRELFTY